MKHMKPLGLLVVAALMCGCGDTEPRNYHITLQPGPPPSINTDKPDFPPDIITGPTCTDLACCEQHFGMVPKPCVAVVLEDNGQCTLVSSEDGTPCSDELWCGGIPTCTLGVCSVPEDAVVCVEEDAPSCHTIVCDEDTQQCTAVPLDDDTPCEDGSACSEDDVCNDGQCTAGSSLTCDDNDPCTADECMGAQGCVHTPLSGQNCDDENACTTGDTCQEGSCSGTGVLSCAKDNPCVVGECDPKTGCVTTLLSDTPCDDGNECTDNDFCQDGLCESGENTCECTKDNDCPEPENLCTGALFCDKNQCTADPKNAVQCQPSADPCMIAVCQPQTGTCIEKPVEIDTECDDDNACTVKDICQEGECIGKPVLCKDDFECTKDSCDPDLGCTFTNGTGQDCSDGNPCTTDDICEDGSCIGGPPIECDDGESCTADSCNATTGCLYTPVGGDCYGPDPCKVGSCVNGSCEAFVAVKCVPSSPCVTASCEFDAQGCVETPIDCDDDNVCTDDDCAPNTGCFHTKKSCDDDDPCTTDACENGACNHLPVNCNDGNPCTLGECNGGLCFHNPVNCSDGLDCTDDVCDGGDCFHDWDDSACDDENTCTSDGCTEDGCKNKPIEGSCDDDNDETADDQCVKGVCIGTPIVDNQTCRTILNTDPTATDGVYTIDPDKDGPKPAFEVYCDMTTKGGGWVLFGDINHAANNFPGSVHIGMFNSGTIGNSGYSLDIDRFYEVTGANFDLLIQYGDSKVHVESHNGYTKPQNGSFLVPPTQMDAIGEHGLLGTGPAGGFYATYCAVMWGCMDNGNDFFNFSTNGEYPKNWNHVPCGYYGYEPAKWKNCPSPADKTKRMRYFFRE